MAGINALKWMRDFYQNAPHLRIFEHNRALSAEIEPAEAIRQEIERPISTLMELRRAF
jgi:hypothetical protein